MTSHSISCSLTISFYFMCFANFSPFSIFSFLFYDFLKPFHLYNFSFIFSLLALFYKTFSNTSPVLKQVEHISLLGVSFLREAFDLFQNGGSIILFSLILLSTLGCVLILSKENASLHHPCFLIPCVFSCLTSLAFTFSLFFVLLNTFLCFSVSLFTEGSFVTVHESRPRFISGLRLFCCPIISLLLFFL